MRANFTEAIARHAGHVRLMTLAIALPFTGRAINLIAADADAPAPKPADRTEIRRPFRDLSPEEREARFKEMEQRLGPAPFTFEELRKMTPEERQAKLRQWREGRLSFTPEERQRRRAQIKQRLMKQIAELQKAKAAGKLSDEDRARLERLELLASRFDRLTRPSVNASVPSNNSITIPKNPK